jgi:hypothetical protein
MEGLCYGEGIIPPARAKVARPAPIAIRWSQPSQAYQQHHHQNGNTVHDTLQTSTETLNTEYTIPVAVPQTQPISPFGRGNAETGATQSLPFHQQPRPRPSQARAIARPITHTHTHTPTVPPIRTNSSSNLHFLPPHGAEIYDTLHPLAREILDIIVRVKTLASTRARGPQASPNRTHLGMPVDDEIDEAQRVMKDGVSIEKIVTELESDEWGGDEIE